MFGMAIYTAVKCPNFSTGYSDSASKATTKTVPKTVRNGLSLIQKIRSKKTTQTNTSGLMNIFSQFFKWANRFYILLVWLDARITPRSLSAVLLIKAEKK